MFKWMPDELKVVLFIILFIVLLAVIIASGTYYYDSNIIKIQTESIITIIQEIGKCLNG